jgi:hypothetical protein
MPKDSYRVAAWAVGTVIGVVTAFALYAKGWDAGEKSGRMWGEFTGHWRGMVDMTKVLSDRG